MVANTTESTTQLTQQLEMMHSKVIATLTVKAHDILNERAYFDLRNLMIGTNKYLDCLAKVIIIDCLIFCFLLQSNE